MANPNLELLIIAARQLGHLLDELVFVGGCVTGLLITDEADPSVRPTNDVDTIVEAATYARYMRFSKRLKAVGFLEDTRDDAPMCRWVKENIVLDVMPLDEKTLGFTNIWYESAHKNSEPREIAPGLTIKVISPPYFCATKIEAFKGRGKGDYRASHDLEDLITVIDGREEIVEEISTAPADVRQYLADEMRRFLETRGFSDALPGHLSPDAGSQGRLGILIERLKQISLL